MTNSLQTIASEAFDPMAGTLAAVDLPFPPVVTDDEWDQSKQIIIPPEEVNVTILALDLGTKCGFSVRRRDGRVVHGMADFTPRASWTPAQKWLRFCAWLSGLIVEHNVQQIAFEDVKRHALGAVLAAHAYGGFRAHMEAVAGRHNCTLHPYGVGQIKQHWTGSGVAKKPEMVAQAKVRGFRVTDDNEADALAILHLAVAHERGTWVAPERKDKPKTKRAPKAQGALI